MEADDVIIEADISDVALRDAADGNVADDVILNDMPELQSANLQESVQLCCSSRSLSDVILDNFGSGKDVPSNFASWLFGIIKYRHESTAKDTFSSKTELVELIVQSNLSLSSSLIIEVKSFFSDTDPPSLLFWSWFNLKSGSSELIVADELLPFSLLLLFVVDEAEAMEAESLVLQATVVANEDCGGPDLEQVE